MKTTVVKLGIWGFKCKVDEICAPLGYYAAYNGNSCPLKMGPIGWPKTLVGNYQYMMCNHPEELKSCS